MEGQQVNIFSMFKKRLQPVDDVRADTVVPALGISIADNKKINWPCLGK
jgi:hypothetical protein